MMKNSLALPLNMKVQILFVKTTKFTKFEEYTCKFFSESIRCSVIIMILARRVYNREYDGYNENYAKMVLSEKS